MDAHWEQIWWVSMVEGMIFSPQDLILQFFELSLSGSDVDDQRILLFLQLWSFLPNHNAQ